MSMDELTHALCRQAGALRDRGAGSQTQSQPSGEEFYDDDISF